MTKKILIEIINGELIHLKTHKKEGTGTTK